MTSLIEFNSTQKMMWYSTNTSHIRPTKADRCGRIMSNLKLKEDSLFALLIVFVFFFVHLLSFQSEAISSSNIHRNSFLMLCSQQSNELIIASDDDRKRKTKSIFCSSNWLKKEHPAQKKEISHQPQVKFEELSVV